VPVHITSAYPPCYPSCTESSSRDLRALGAGFSAGWPMATRMGTFFESGAPRMCLTVPRAGKTVRDVCLHLRIAATRAGLGEIGWSKVFLTEEFGPRQRRDVILTEAELQPDPIRTGHLCDRCKRCVAECPAGAIPKDKAVSIEVEGHTVKWGDIDLGKCKLTHFGLNRKNEQFMAKRYPGLYLPMAGQQVSWKEAWDLGWSVFASVPYAEAVSKCGGPALCGARGCMIGCMKHMEERGRVKNTFRVKPVFSEERPWELPEKPEPATPHGFLYDPGAHTQARKPTLQPERPGTEVFWKARACMERP
jgi:ferredoxin